MSTLSTVKAQLQNLIDISNRVTGKSDTDLTGVVNTLVNERDSFITGDTSEEIYSEVTKVGRYGLAGKPNLISVTLPNVIDIGYQGLSNNISLKNVNIPNATNLDTHVFYGDTGLESISLPSISYLASNTFNGCTSLKIVSLSVLGSIGSNCFTNCNEFAMLIIKNKISIASLGNINSFNNTPIASGTGYIYVPRNLIESYKTATNWATFASQFRALEDYTVDGTIDGELDWDKVNGGTA